MGFFNFFLSLGISFFALALIWSGKRADALLALALTPLLWLAHPLGLAWLVAATLYVVVTRKLRPGRQLGPMLGAALAIVALREFITLRWKGLFWKAPFYTRNGTDQLVLYAPAYRSVAFLLLAAAAAFLLLSAAQRWQDGDRSLTIAVSSQLYLLSVWALIVLPDAVFLPSYTVPVTMIIERFSLVAAVLGCAVLAGMKPHRLHALVFTLIALFFFGLYYEDTLRVNRMEQQVESLVAQLPPGQRVIATIYPLPGTRIFVHHIVDRACIGHCFSYDNYEPASQQFRLRARPGNGMVTADSQEADKMKAGVYQLKADDPPLYQIYQCDSTGTKLCMRPLKPGESTSLVPASSR